MFFVCVAFFVESGYEWKRDFWEKNMADIFDEVQEELQQEKLLRFWNKYQKFIRRGIYYLLVGSCVFAYWQYRQGEIREEASTDYTHALLFTEMKKPERALEILESMANKTGNSYADLSKLLGADLLIKQEKYGEASDAYWSLVKTGNDRALKDLALIKLGYLEADPVKGSKTRAETLVKELAPLLKEKNPWFLLALEASALLHNRLDQKDQTVVLYKKILENKKASPSLRMRAELMLKSIR